jgi:hypothetical protein
MCQYPTLFVSFVPPTKCSPSDHKHAEGQALSSLDMGDTALGDNNG